jgi:predicted regulator of Ras-like GTPase activity (Roadblock/LC7/MglB family)
VANPLHFLDFASGNFYVHPMVNLRQLVQELVQRPGVEAAVLLSGDGLPIEHALTAGPPTGGPLDPDALAALAATLMRNTARLGEAAGWGSAASLVVEYDRGLAVLTRLAEHDWLMLLTGPNADVGELLYDLRRHRPVLAALL